VRRMTESRRNAWMAALDHLSESCSPREVREACEDLVNLPEYSPSRTPQARVAQETGLSVGHADASAFLIVARELWAGNEELSKKLGRGRW
jgi:hypothetical protein